MERDLGSCTLAMSNLFLSAELASPPLSLLLLTPHPPPTLTYASHGGRETSLEQLQTSARIDEPARALSLARSVLTSSHPHRSHLKGHKVKMARTKSCESLRVFLPSTFYKRLGALTIGLTFRSPSSFHHEKGHRSPRTVRSSPSNESAMLKLTFDAVVPCLQDPSVRALARLSHGTCNLFALGVSMARAWRGLRAYEPFLPRTARRRPSEEGVSDPELETAQEED